MIWVIAGTTNGMVVAEKLLRSGYHVVVTTSAEYGSSIVDCKENLIIRHGELGKTEMGDLLDELNIRLIIDASHPFSEDLKQNLWSVTEIKSIPLIELGRSSVSVPDAHASASFSEAAHYLSGKEGNVLLSIGTKNIWNFIKIGKDRIYAKVVPAESAIAACIDAGILHENIIAMKHSFSLEFEKALMKEFDIKYLVLRESGAESGIIAKTGAAIQSGVEVIVIKKPESRADKIYFDIDEIVSKAGEILK